VLAFQCVEFNPLQVVAEAWKQLPQQRVAIAFKRLTYGVNRLVQFSLPELPRGEVVRQISDAIHNPTVQAWRGLFIHGISARHHSEPQAGGNHRHEPERPLLRRNTASLLASPESRASAMTSAATKAPIQPITNFRIKYRR
jgi:hypothetical protein